MREFTFTLNDVGEFAELVSQLEEALNVIYEHLYGLDTDDEYFTGVDDRNVRVHITPSQELKITIDLKDLDLCF